MAAKAAHILVVDDEPLTAAGLTQYLALQGYQTRAVHSVREALDAIDKQMPDIVLLDLVMPEEGGMELLAELRQDPETQTLPVIVTSALKDTDDIVGALRAGANDYITKPVDLQILLARVERHLALAEAMAGLARQSELQWQMTTGLEDPSGACNRKLLFESLESEIHRSGRHGSPLSLLVIELDQYSGVSGEHGIAAADAMLRQFVESMAGALRRSDRLCRADAHTFCAVLPQTDEPGALRAAEQIRQWMENIAFTIDSQDVTSTVSIGVVSLRPEHEGGAETLVTQGTQAMLDAKRQGQNRVAIYGADSPEQAAVQPA
ncbi:MAG: GGDEF domain-containing response regulator [Candidatus Sumerlaeaceae bacterium]